MFGLVQHAPQWFGWFAIAVVVVASVIALVWFALVIGIVVPAVLRLWRKIHSAKAARASGTAVAALKQLAAPAETLEGAWRYADGSTEVQPRRLSPARWQ